MQKTIGNCTRCDKENCHVTIVDDVDRVCDECLDAFFTQCADCGEYCEDGYVDFFLTKDDRLICEYCREDYDDEDIVEDDE
jgi:hypothetical protein